MRHVSGRLAAFVAGQLTPRQEAAVRKHVSRCATCCEQLARHERLAADLRLALGRNITPSPAQVQAWWENVAARPAMPRPGRAAFALLPVLLSLLLLVVPLAANVSAAPAPQQTEVSPAIDAANYPPVRTGPVESETASAVKLVAMSIVPTQQPATTPPPAVPVPSAPPTP